MLDRSTTAKIDREWLLRAGVKTHALARRVKGLVYIPAPRLCSPRRCNSGSACLTRDSTGDRDRCGGPTRIYSGRVSRGSRIFSFFRLCPRRIRTIIECRHNVSLTTSTDDSPNDERLKKDSIERIRSRIFETMGGEGERRWAQDRGETRTKFRSR